MEVISFNDTQLSGNCIIGTAMNSHNMMFSVWGSQTKFMGHVFLQTLKLPSCGQVY